MPMQNFRRAAVRIEPPGQSSGGDQGWQAPIGCSQMSRCAKDVEPLVAASLMSALLVCC